MKGQGSEVLISCKQALGLRLKRWAQQREQQAGQSLCLHACAALSTVTAV